MEQDLNLPPPPDSEAAKGKRRNHDAASPRPAEDILAGSGYEHLPEVFIDHRDGAMVQEREPAYYITAETALGAVREVTLYEEGAIVVTSLTPNDVMQPLNRAAAVQVVKWLAKLPGRQAPIDIGDMAEAAQMLGSDPEVLKLNRVEWQNAVVKMANELKLRREGKEARELPPIGHNFIRGVKPGAPPILGARLAAMAEQFPGATRLASAVPAYGPGAQTRRATPAPMSSSGR